MELSMFQVVRFFITSGILVGVLAGSGGCASAPGGAFDEQKSGQNQLHSVVLRPGFVLNVAVIVYGVKEIDEPSKRITDAGDITLPMLGKIHVEGLTLEAVSAGLAELYKAYFVQPRVIVEFNIDPTTDASSPWGYVTVLGRVVRPGRVNIPATRDLTVSGAIQRAGGFSSSARESGIRINRRKSDGKTDTLKVDLRSVGTEGKAEEDIVLQSGDIVFVPESIF